MLIIKRDIIILKIYLFLIIISLLYGCTEPSTQTDIPSTPAIGDYPQITTGERLTIFGTKERRTEIRLNSKRIIPLNNSTKWSYDLSLQEGKNTFTITSMDNDLNESPPLIVEVLLDNDLPLPPEVNQITTPTDITVQIISGTKEADTSIFINGELAVENNPYTEWSYLETLSFGENKLLISARDIAGNESISTEVSIELTVTPPSPTFLISPPDNDRIKNTIPRFNWSSISNIDKYIFDISPSPGFSSLTIEPEPVVTIPTYSISSPIESGSYYWRIGSVDLSGNISYSKARKIKIGRLPNDINGDGYSDIAVSAPYRDAGETNIGEVYIYFGGESVDDIPDVILTGEAEGDGFGYSISIGGDINNDGYDDIAVSSIFNDKGGVDSGRVYIYFGGESVDDIPDVILTGEAEGDGFGYSVSIGGDINNDGYDDIIVGSPLNNKGSAYLYLGGIYMDNMPDLIIKGEENDDGFGYSISIGGDINNDGYSDIIIGSPFNDANGNNAGRAYIYLGGKTIDSIPDFIMTGIYKGDQFGYSVSYTGDINRDGFSDILIGAIRGDSVRADFGAAYLYFGGIIMYDEADIIFRGEASSNFFGYRVSTASDLNNDGFDDIIISAPYNDSGGFDTGRAYIYWGGEEMDNVADLIITGLSEGGLFGYSLSPAGDINGDGYSDLIISAPYSNTGGIDRGEALIYFGGDPMDSVEDIRLIGRDSSDNFGLSVR
ncbi:MAG: hypothetical protein ACE5EA_08865 [Nitrospirota bacterium]